MSNEEHPTRFPPPLSQSKMVDGFRGPDISAPFMECGQKVQLRADWVVCIRQMGHPVRMDFGHSNGYAEWAFDER
jgi:hypothetical protein